MPQTALSHSFYQLHTLYIMSGICINSFLLDIKTLIIAQQDANYSVYYISIGSSTCFGCWQPIIRSSYNCNYSSCYWLTGSTTIRSRCWVGTDSCVSYGRYVYSTVGISTVRYTWIRYTYRTIHMNQVYLPYDTHESGIPTVRYTWIRYTYLTIHMNQVYLPYDTHESVPTQQRDRMVVDPVNQYQKL